jgi:RND superfamily putative drug exporter
VILIVVLFGIGTDYILFFLFRYRERLRHGVPSRQAVAEAVERAGEAIASAGGAVIVSFMALILSSLGIFRSIGPALAIAVAVTVLAALTLVPAIVALLGSKVFWPSKSWKREPEGNRFAAIGGALGRRPALFATVSGGLLAVLALFAFGFNPTFDLGDSGAPSNVESSVALRTLQKGLPAGATDPTIVLLHSDDGSPLDQSELTGSEPTSARRRASHRWHRVAPTPTAARRSSTSSSTKTRRRTPRSQTSRAPSATRRTRPHPRAPLPWSAGPRPCSWTSRRP